VAEQVGGMFLAGEHGNILAMNWDKSAEIGVSELLPKKAISYVQPSVFDMLAGASPASAMDGWAE